MRLFLSIPTLLAVGFLLGPSSLSAQGFSPRFDHLTPESGLSQDIVTSIAQDRDGFLWFGTEDGLNRYDGTSFRVFKNIPDDSASLLLSRITEILATPDGTLWIAAQGLNRYDPMSESFVRYPLDWLDPVAATNGSEALALCADSTGALWVSTGSSLVRVHPDLRTVERFRHRPGDPASLSADRVEALLCDRQGRLWVGTSSGVDRYDSASGGFLRVLPSEGGNGGSRGTSVSALHEDRHGNIWIGFKEEGAVCLDPRSGNLRRFRGWTAGPRGLSDGRVFDIEEDAQGRIWIGHFSGADVYDPEVETLSRLKKDPQLPSSISGTRVYAILHDRRGTVWLGTYHGGVSSYSPRKNRFATFRPLPPKGSGAPDFAVYAVAESRRGGLWCGTGYGLEWIGPGADVRPGTLPPGVKLPHLPRATVLALLEDRHGWLWIAYDGGVGLKRVHLQNGTATHIELPLVRTLYEDREGEIWIGLWLDGVVRFDPESGRFHRYRSDEGSEGGLIGGGVWSIHEARDGTLWMGTWGTQSLLNRFDRSAGRFSTMPPVVRNTEKFPTIAVRGIAEEPDGTLWFGTWGTGLRRYEPRTERFDQFLEADGLPNSFVKGVLLDDHSNLWVSTERGLVCRERSTGRFVHFTKSDGLSGERFLSGSALRGRDGRIYFGGEQGLAFFHPDSIRPNPLPPPVVITAFRIFDRPQPPSAWARGTVHLEHAQDFISFEFVALDYNDPGRNQYAYKMEGFDRDWIEAGTRRYAAYTHLDGGEYRFRVRAATSDGTWNMEGASVRILISPPYWRTWWFIAGVVLAGVAIIYGGFRIRLRQQLEIERIRQRIAGDLHDDVGTELSSIVVGSQILARTLPLEEEQREKIRDLGLLARRSHEMIRDIVWVLSPDIETIDDVVLKMREIAGRLLDGKTLSLEFSVPPERQPIALEVRRNFFLFYKECLNNIVRHAGATSVWIRLRVTSEGMELFIADDGKGFEVQGDGPGLGMANLRRRAAEMKARLQIESNPAGGTAISLQIRLT